MKRKCVRVRETYKDRCRRRRRRQRTRRGTAFIHERVISFISFLFLCGCCCSIQSHARRFVFHYFVLFAFLSVFFLCCVPECVFHRLIEVSFCVLRLVFLSRWSHRWLCSAATIALLLLFTLPTRTPTVQTHCTWAKNTSLFVVIFSILFSLIFFSVPWVVCWLRRLWRYAEHTHLVCVWQRWKIVMTTIRTAHVRVEVELHQNRYFDGNFSWTVLVLPIF